MVTNTQNLPDTRHGFGAVSNNRTTPEHQKKRKKRKKRKNILNKLSCTFRWRYMPLSPLDMLDVVLFASSFVNWKI
jgi:hypothetical protein